MGLLAPEEVDCEIGLPSQVEALPPDQLKMLLRDALIPERRNASSKIQRHVDRINFIEKGIVFVELLAHLVLELYCAMIVQRILKLKKVLCDG
jgi:hypothetical protein